MTRHLIVRVIHLRDEFVVVERDASASALIRTRRYDLLEAALADAARTLSRSGLLARQDPAQKNPVTLDV